MSPARNAEPHRELFVLGMLRRRPLSAYEVDRILREHFPLYRRFRLGNLYQLIERLYDRGYLAAHSATARRGPRSSKAVYREGSPAAQAVVLAGAARFRPIVMTTTAMVAGMLPLALGATVGAEYRRALGIVVIGGLLTSLLLTLFVVPVVYVWIRDRKKRTTVSERSRTSYRRQPALHLRGPVA